MFGSKDVPPALNLVFSPHLRVAGEAVEGEAQLYFPTLMEEEISEVQIKFRGTLFTRVERDHPHGDAGTTHQTVTRTVKLCDETRSVWQKGSLLYPPPGTHVLSIPFRFVLPGVLLPSIDYSGNYRKGVVGYLVEVTGTRHGLHRDRSVKTSFPVLPVDPQGGWLSSALRTSGWTGGYRAVEQHEEMRRGIFGDYSHVKATLILPDVAGLPIFTPIPFSLNIVTTTKTMKLADTPDDEPVFPAPPVDPKDIEFSLERKVVIRAGLMTSTSSWERIVYLGGLGPSEDLHFYDNMQVLPADRVWIPSPDPHDEKKGKGQWKQEVTFKSYFVLNCAPSFHAENMDLNYRARFKIDFPGIGNDVKQDFLLNITTCMSPLASGAWTGPPPSLDLPPAYFNDIEEWDVDHKRG